MSKQVTLMTDAIPYQESRPKEIRDGWLMWLGLGEPR